MIRFSRVESKKIEIYKDEELLLDLDIVITTVTNKFNIVTSYIEDISKNIKGFDEWFSNFIIEYNNSEEKYKVLEGNIDNIKKYSDEYINFRNINFNKFVDLTKIKKNTVVFSSEDIEKIIRLSGYLKIYSIISNSQKIKLDHRLHKSVYNLFSSDIDMDLIHKIYNVVKMKTFRYNMTDKYMWDYIKSVQCRTIDVHIIQIFNFIMNQILVLCEIDKNPITYFVTVVDESVKWFLRSVYTASVVYDDSISTEDIQSTNRDNLRTYSYNDTLGRLKGIAYRKIHETIEGKGFLLADSDNMTSDNDILELQKRIESVQYISPICNCLVYPILSGVTGIPYDHMKTLSAEHAIILSAYVKYLMDKVFDNEYPTITQILEYYPKEKPSIGTSYKLKSMEYFVNYANHVNDFYGFKNKKLLGDMLGTFVGLISRNKLINIIDGKESSGIHINLIEKEMIHFYNQYFSGRLDHKFEEMRKYCLMEF